MNKKEIKNSVLELLSNGMTKKQVFNELSLKGAKEKTIAFFIANHADPDRCKNNKSHVNVIVAISCLITIITFFAGYGIAHDFGTSARLFIAILCALIPAAFVYGFYKNSAGTYNAYIILSVVQFPKMFIGFSSEPISTLIAIGINVCILGYIIYVRNKLFPDFGFISPKKSNGQYIFAE